MRLPELIDAPAPHTAAALHSACAMHPWRIFAAATYLHQSHRGCHTHAEWPLWPLTAVVVLPPNSVL